MPTVKHLTVIILLFSSALLCHAQRAQRLPDTVQLAADSSYVWDPAPSMSTTRAYLAAAALNNKIYAIGGQSISPSAVEVYDPATNMWSAAPSMPAPRIRLAAAVLNNKLYVIGGEGNGGLLNTVDVYDPATNAWSAAPSMPTPRSALAAVVLNNKIYAIGGGSYPGYLNTVEVYDPATNAWSSAPGMPTPRAYLAAAVLNDKIYAIGGSDNNLAVLKTVEVYDPVTNAWSAAPNLPTTRTFLAAATLNNKIYALGGYRTDIFLTYLETVVAYDPATNAWSSAPSMPTQRAYLAAAALNDKIYVMGGNNPTFGLLKTVDVFERACPIINGISPTGGGEGDMVVIYGRHMTSTTAVKFANNVPATFTVNTDSQLTATVPAGAVPGPITLSGNGCTDVQTAAFTAVIPVSIKGKATSSGAGMSGVKLTLSSPGAADRVTTTIADGTYFFSNVLTNASYTVTPTHPVYNFLTTSRTYTNLASNQVGQNFATGTRKTYSVSGRLMWGTAGLAGLNVTLTSTVPGFTPRTVKTAATTGLYTFTKVPAGYAYTVAPAPSNLYTFTPVGRSIPSLVANVTNQNFPATLKGYGISGQVSYGATLLSGVKMTLTSTTPGFIPRVATTVSGKYSFTGVPAGRSYVLTPTHVTYGFTPVRKSYPTLTANQTAQNFTAALRPYVVSGKVTVGTAAFSGVKMTLTSSTIAGFTPRAVLTDSGGNYKLTGLTYGQTYTVTPSYTGYVFTPTNRTYPGITGDKLQQNYTTAPKLYTVSGKVSFGAAGLGGVTVTLSNTATGGVVKTVTTLNNGSYTITGVPERIAYTLTPKMLGYRFTPESKSLALLKSNLTRQDFAALDCLSILPDETLVEAGGETGKIAVVASGDCGWTAKSNAAWVTISSGLSGTGNGKVEYAVAANTGTASRTGTLTIAGKTFTVTQAGARNLTPTLSQSTGRPGQTLVIQGSGFDPGAKTSVIFRDQNGYKMEMPAFAVTSSQVKVLIPVYMDTATLQTGVGIVSVSVVQDNAGAVTNFVPVYGFQITDLPQVSLPPGIVTLTVLVELQKMLYAAAREWQRIQEASNGAANLTPLIANLQAMQAKFHDQEAVVRRLVDGTALSVPLGEVGGRQVSLNRDGLALMDRIYVAFILKGCPSCSSAVSSASAAALEDLADLVRKEIASAIYDTADGALEAGGRLRSVTNMVVKLGVFAAVAIATEVSAPVIAGVVVGTLVWNATTWVPLAHSVILRSMSLQMNNGTMTAETFRREGEFLAQAAYDGAKILDKVIKPISAPTLESELITTLQDKIFSAVNHFNFSDPSSPASQVEDNVSQIQETLPTLPPVQSAITVGDDGLAADDAFQVVLDGEYLGETAVGESNTLNVDVVLPGPHTLTVTCTVATDDRGTLSVSLSQGLMFEDGSTSKSEVLTQGGSVSYTVIAP